MSSAKLVFVLVPLALVACSRSTPEEVTTTSTGASSQPSDAGLKMFDAAGRPVLRKDDRGLVDAGLATTEPLGDLVNGREPDWDLDPQDAARDYVLRYIRATQRYGDKSKCVTVLPSTDNGARRQVVVKDDPKSSCFAGGGASAEPRDVFLVDPANDRLSVDDPSKRAPLRKWPDGSDPEAPAAPVSAVDNSTLIKGPIRQALVDLKQSPIRLQLYGRGTYPVLTLAGWHAPIERDVQSPELTQVAQKLCAASEGAPLGLFGGMDRTLLLRIRCPGEGPVVKAPTAVWQPLK